MMIPVLNLSNLDGNNGFIINGANSREQLGRSVSNAGDINGDGINDIIVGAPGTSSRDVSPTEEVYIIFGTNNIGNSGNLNVSNLNGSNGFVINGINRFDSFGSAVSNAGDINGDGIDDIVIGAPSVSNYQNDPTIFNLGQTYVVFGGSNLGSSGSLEVSDLDGNNGFSITGIQQYDTSGISVSNAGDLNGDGVDDILIGASAYYNGSKGETYVVFGGSNLGSDGNLELSDLDGTNGFVINGVDNRDSANAISNAGDLNGDGIDDIIIGARYADPNNKENAGETYVVFGDSNIGNSGSLELSALDGVSGFTINGIDENDNSGFSVSDAGDVNGDGFADIIIGASRAGEIIDGYYSSYSNPTNSRRGESYIIFGGSNIGSSGNLELSNLDGSDGFKIEGVDIGDRFGASVSSAGDVNGDGIDDILIGAPYAGDIVQGYYGLQNDRRGESYLIFGSSSLGSGGSVELANLDASDGLVIRGIDGFILGVNSSGDRSGSAVSNAGDLNGDGLEDIVIGAFRAEYGGESYVIFGDRNIADSSDTIFGTEGNDSLFGTLDSDNIFALAGNDTVVSLFADDFISGGEGNDSLFGNNGNDTIEGDSGDDTLWGQGNEDFVSGGAGNDFILGNNGNDLLNGGDGADTIFGNNDNDSLFGDGGNDSLIGNRGNDTIEGGDGADTLFGNQNNDVLVGGAGNDLIFGNDGNDNLTGNRGVDTLRGGAGNDIFNITRGQNTDRIKDYVDGEDKINIIQPTFNSNLTFADLTFVQNGSNVQIRFTQNGFDEFIAAVENTNVSDLDASDFV